MKERITITIDKKLLKLLDEKIKEKIFANRSHGIEFLVFKEVGGKKDENKQGK
jgi:metal-responsive CopG/Arc/MetJ family transcriptional regulator